MTAFALLGWGLTLIRFVTGFPTTVFVLTRTLRKVAAAKPRLADPPRLAVVVPARDEGANVTATLESLLASDYPRLEVIAVDDRSQDDTGARMRAVADADGSGRLRVMTIGSLPDGWLGKCHACEVAQQTTDAEWILFTDGDATYAPDGLSRAMRVAVGDGLDLLTLIPRTRFGGLLEATLLGGFGLTMLGVGRAWQMRFAWSKAAVGAGPFLLVRAATYRASGSHEGIKLSVVEDVDLAGQMKAYGGKTDVLLVGRDEDVAFRWQPSAWGVVTGLTKNAFAAAGYSWPRLIVGTTLLSLAQLFPYVAVFWSETPLLSGWFVSIVLGHVFFAVVAWSMALPPAVIPFLPVALLGILLAFFRSAAVTTRQGGVRWRETFYDLATLRTATSAYNARLSEMRAVRVKPER
ncbi:MAG: glycosyltransferase [Planctomycetota bacterium]